MIPSSEVSREEARNMAEAHIDGFHDEFPRQFCPLCDDRPMQSYPTAREIEERRNARAS